MPYTQLQQMFDEGARWGLNYYEKAPYLDRLSDEAVSMIIEHQTRKTSPLSMLELVSLGGPTHKLNVPGSGRSGRRCAHTRPVPAATSMP